MKIGIIGKGFVGSAVAFGFSASTGYDSTIRIFDKDPDKATHSLEQVVVESDFIFISVPTFIRSRAANLSSSSIKFLLICLSIFVLILLIELCSSVSETSIKFTSNDANELT